MKSYKIENLGGHIVLNLNGLNTVLDTGSPISISNQPIEFLGRNYKLNNGYQNR